MSKSGLFSVLGVLAVVAGCGSSDSNTGVASGTGGTGGLGTTNGTGGLGTTNGTGGLRAINGTGGLGTTNGTGGLGTTNGTGGSGTTGGNGSTGTCNIPSCIATLMNACVPSGTCVDQTDLTTYSSNDCFANGVKIITSVDMTTLAIVMTYKNGSSTCYSVEATGTTTTAALTIKNASGTVVATGTEDTTSTTLTCTGGQPVTLDANCDSTALTGDTSNCTTGTCTP